MKSLTEEWLRAAEDDLDVIERIIGEDHLTNIVAFHAQQAVEKGFKAVLEEREIETPKIHNLVTLNGKIAQLVQERFNMTMLKTLDSLYIDSRYPGELGLLSNGRPTVDDAKSFYEFALMVFRILSSYLRKV